MRSDDRGTPIIVVGHKYSDGGVFRMQSDREEYYKYGGWWTVWWSGTYSMVLTKAAFFHRKYLSLYTNHMPAAIRDYVTKNRYFSSASFPAEGPLARADIFPSSLFYCDAVTP